MHGAIPYLSIDDSVSSFIDLSSNKFEGSLPFISSNPFWLDLSSNLFSGEISSFLCTRPTTIQILNLGDNLLSGEISDCLMNWNYALVIRFTNNFLSGNIPNSIGEVRDLRILDLHNTSVSGEIPISLQNCQNLLVLDLSQNELIGEIPSWMWQQFQSMKILNLRENKFYGLINKQLCGMTSLHILDFANNSLNGTIPKCINNLSAMFNEIKGLVSGTFSADVPILSTYHASSSIVKRGKLMEYSTTLNFVKSLDLSDNKLSGDIPEEITSLGGLQSLNLSHNILSGKIPKNVGAMRDLESLDFSQNQLCGEIPQSMSSLTFLNYLNLSNNKLSGRIPSSAQLQSLDPSGFGGNSLCGPPLTQNCDVDEVKPDVQRGKTKDDVEIESMDWFYFYVSIALGFVIGFWGVVGPLLIKRRWRHLYFAFLSDMWDQTLVWFHVYILRVVNPSRGIMS